MLWVFQDLISKPNLNDAAFAHHSNPMREQTRDRKVMRYKNDGQTMIGNETTQQIKEPSLHGNIETTGRFIHKDETRPRNHIPRNLQTLAHSSENDDGLSSIRSAAISTRASQSCASWRISP